MKLSTINLFIIFYLLSVGSSYSQGKLDSVLSMAKAAKNWQDRISIYSKAVSPAKANHNYSALGILYYNMGGTYFNNSMKDSALSHYKKSLPCLIRDSNYLVAGKLYNNVALLKINETDTALYYAQLSLKYRTLSKDSLEMAHAHLLIADLYDRQGIFSLSLQHCLSAIRIYEKKTFNPGLINVYNNIAVLFGRLDEQRKKLHYQLLAVALLKQQNDTLKLSSGYNNLANAYSTLEMYDSALYVHHIALKFREERNNTYGIAETKYNIADVYFEQGECDKALPYIRSAVVAFEKVNPTIAFLYGYNLYGKILDCTGDYSKSEPLLIKAYETSVKVRSLPEKNKILKSLSEHYAKKGQFSKAYEHRLMYEATKDSLFDKEKIRVVKELETGFDAEKRELQIHSLKQEKELQEKELVVTTAKEQEQRIISYSVTAGLGLVLLFAIFVFNRLRLTRKQKLVIEKQKLLVDEKNKEITDSIHYAKRIQTAILPPQKLVKGYLTESFILYKPKDIVAGDFYWFEAPSNSPKGGEQTPSPLERVGQGLFFAAADCTGHGVPGAMVSVMCANALTKAVKENAIYEPAKILDKASALLEERFERSEEDVKDGMDIALCCLTLPPLEEVGGGLLQYAGANNPLWLIRNGELIETKADKQPIGKHENRKPFTNHSIELQKGDSIYIFSDGYPDQFGGPNGKKFKSKAFKELLFSIQGKSMEEQKQIIDEAFENWKGELEQVDDVCVIGVRV